MSVLKEVYEHLSKIKNGEVSFQYLLNKGFKNVDSKVAFLVKDTLKSTVNRYYFLSWELDKIFKLENENARDYLICALGQFHYVKEISDEQLLEFLKEDLPTIDEKISVSEFFQAIKTLNNTTLSLSEKDNENIIRKLSLNYSYPEWVCKMISKHFGVKKIYKSIASSRKNIAITVNCNSFFTNADKLIEEYPSLFTRGVLTNNTLRYIGKEKIIDVDVFKKNYVFVEDETSQLLVNNLNLEVNDTALVIADDRGAIALDMLMKIKDVGTIHAAASNVINYNSTLALANRFKLHSLNCFESTVDCLLTHVEAETCDKVLLVAPSTQLGLVRRKPDVILTLNRDNLDSIIAEQKRQIKEASTFVRKGGVLEYAVFTYNKKESTFIVQDFLNNNPDFTLLEENQIFAYEAPSDGVYYALIKKN